MGGGGGGGGLLAKKENRQKESHFCPSERICAKWPPLRVVRAEKFLVEQFPESFGNKRVERLSAKPREPHRAAEYNLGQHRR